MSCDKQGHDSSLIQLAAVKDGFVYYTKKQGDWLIKRIRPLKGIYYGFARCE